MHVKSSLLEFVFLYWFARWRYHRRRTWTARYWRSPITCLCTTIPSTVDEPDGLTHLMPVRCDIITTGL